MSGKDPVLARREMIRRFASLGQRVGYLLFAAAIVLFVVGFAAGFTPTLVSVIVTAMAVGSLLLAPAIVMSYAVRAADEDDAAAGPGAAGRDPRQGRDQGP